MNDDFFSEKQSSLGEGVRSFDAFPKTRTTYTTRSSRGGLVTLSLLTFCLWLTWGELSTYISGTSHQHFLVEKSIGHEMQINLDITIAMPCDTLHINVQDASGDRILAGELLVKDETSFDDTRAHRLLQNELKEQEVYDVLKNARKSKFEKTRRGGKGSCRVYGSMDVNRVQGDFHITAKGHGYWDSGVHVEHDSFNFSHVVNELSFGELYPKLINPLDGVVASTEEHFYKFQYYISIVPTVYESTTNGHTLLTNQYAVTEHSRTVATQAAPGIFFKFDIEPISLTVTDSRTPFLQFFVRLVNIIGGVLVSGGWVYKFGDSAVGVFRKKKGGGRGEGMLTGRRLEEAEEEE